MYSYKKIDHFNKILKNTQGILDDKTEIEIANNIINDIKNEFIINKPDNNKFEFCDIGLALKKLKYCKYYNYSHYIYCKLNNYDLPLIPNNIIIKLNEMFINFSNNWDIYIKNQNLGISFLSYTFLCNMFLNILEEYQYIHLFSSATSKEKMLYHK
jgi:hypothetical protein